MYQLFSNSVDVDRHNYLVHQMKLGLGRLAVALPDK